MINLLNRDFQLEAVQNTAPKGKNTRLKVMNETSNFSNKILFQRNCKLDTFTLKKPPGETNW